MLAVVCSSLFGAFCMSDLDQGFNFGKLQPVESFNK